MSPPTDLLAPRPAPTRPAAGHDPVIRPLTRGMRSLLVVAGVLVFLAGVQLFVFPLRTDRYFAWTINPPLTAVFLGGAYLSSLTFEIAAASARVWSDASIAVPTVFVFTALTLVATLVHLDRFHLGAAHDGATRAVTWVWLAVYVTVPVLMLVLAALQARVPGVDRPRRRRLPAALRLAVGAQAAVLVGAGAALFLAPERAGWWPWSLTPLTARAVGAWGLGLGVAAAHAVWEDDARRLRPAALALVTFGALQAVALARHGGDLEGGVPSLLYAAFLVGSTAIGALTLRLARTDSMPEADASPVAPPADAGEPGLHDIDVDGWRDHARL